MKKLHMLNYTMNSNLAVYLGAYTDKIFSLAILDYTPHHAILHIIPYLKQMRITYKIYSNENTFMEDTDSFRPDTILSAFDDAVHFESLNKIINIFKIDAIVISLKNCLHFERDWYFVTIYNPITNQTTYLYHTNGKENILNLRKLNAYRTIRVG